MLEGEPVAHIDPAALHDPGWSKTRRAAGRVSRLSEELREHPARVPLLALGRMVPVRRAVAALMALRAPRAAAPEPWRSGAIPGRAPPVAAVVETLRRDGIWPGLRLPPALVAAIRAFAEAAPCQGGPGWSVRFTPATRAEPEVAATYGADAILAMTGAAGSGFLEDPFGFHTGTSVRRGRRLMLELSFGITATTRRAGLADLG